MTQYMLSVHHVGSFDAIETAEDDMQQIYADVDEFNQKLMADGTWVFGGGLESPESTTSVDATGDKPVITDGPFVETKEYLGGFWIIEAPDLDAALKIAEAGSAACRGEVRVRPFQAE